MCKKWKVFGLLCLAFFSLFTLQVNAQDLIWQEVGQVIENDGVVLTLEEIYFDVTTTLIKLSLETDEGLVHFSPDSSKNGIIDDAGRRYLLFGGHVGTNKQVQFICSTDGVHPQAQSIELVGRVERDGQLIEGDWSFTVPINQALRPQATYYDFDAPNNEDQGIIVQMGSVIAGETAAQFSVEVFQVPWSKEQLEFQAGYNNILILDAAFEVVKPIKASWRYSLQESYRFDVQVKPDIVAEPFYVVIKDLHVTNLENNEVVNPVLILAPEEWKQGDTQFLDVRKQILSSLQARDNL